MLFSQGENRTEGTYNTVIKEIPFKPEPDSSYGGEAAAQHSEKQAGVAVS